jgi:hypothetical protein
LWILSFWFFQQYPICIPFRTSFVVHSMPISSSSTRSF